MATAAETTAEVEEEQECSVEGKDEREELLKHIRESSLTLEGVHVLCVRIPCVCVVCVCVCVCVCVFVCSCVRWV